jgi:hypothetical protein
MKEDEECDYYRTWIDDSSPQGGDKDNHNVGEDNLNMCKGVVKEMELHSCRLIYMKIWGCKESFNMPWKF